MRALSLPPGVTLVAVAALAVMAVVGACAAAPLSGRSTSPQSMGWRR
jgi:hypothetical protein